MIFARDAARFFGYLPPHYSLLKKCAYLYFSPGMEAVLNYRFGNWLVKQPLPLKAALMPFYLFMRGRVMRKWGIEISPHATIGEGFTIQHFGSIMIAGDVVMGKNCRIRHDVTIGYGGHGQKEGCPTLGDNVMVHPGARIYRRITLGDNVTIGANAVVYNDVPSGAIIACVPGSQILATEGGGARPSWEGGGG